VSTDTYKGDSSAKKFMRAHYWLRVAKTIGWNRFRNGKHLVLASREALTALPLLDELGL
jgi:hypothetical protein